MHQIETYFKGWTEWNSWDECTMTCGGGLKQRAKHCMDTSSYEILEPISCGSVWNVTEQKSCNTDICAGKKITDFITIQGKYVFQNCSMEYVEVLGKLQCRLWKWHSGKKQVMF